MFRDEGTYTPVHTFDMDTEMDPLNGIRRPRQRRELSSMEILFESVFGVGFDLEDPKWTQIAGIGMAFYFIILFTALFSIKYVYYNQYAFAHNIFTSVDTSHVITPGTYLYPPWVNFEYFPSTFQPVVLFEPVFSENGLEFDLEVNFFYRLKKEKLADLYNVYSKNYHDKIISNAKQIIKNTGNKYKVDDYVLKRNVIEEDIGHDLSNEIDRDIGVEIVADLVKITNITFPQVIVQTNLMTAIAQQQNEVELNKQHYEGVLADTNLMVSQLTAEGEQVIQYSLNEANLQISVADSIAINQVAMAKTTGMGLFFQALQILDPKQKIQFMNLFAIFDNMNTTITKGFESNSLFFGK